MSNVTVKNNKQVGSNEMFTVVLPDGSEIHDCKRMTGKNGDWISGPSRSYKDKNGDTKWVNLSYIAPETQKAILAVLDGGSVPDINVDQQGFDDENLPF